VALALYRKYRPATFAEVVGQEHVTEPLRVALTAGRVNHAYLFSGPRGCGKTSSARIMARSLNCAEGPTPDPCGQCESCIALAPEGSGSVDVIELDAASHGGVDDTRELRDRAFFAPAMSRYRVFIIDEAHMVTTQGFNALLKIVEEPPEHLIFIFATTEPEKVLPTIRSRTHHYPFRLIPPGVMRELLERNCAAEGVTVEPAVFPLVIRAGGGSARDTQSVLDQLLSGAGPNGVTYERAIALLGVTDVALIDDMVDGLAATDASAVYGTVERLVEAGHDPRRFASDLLDRLRDLVLLRAVPDSAARGLVTAPGDELSRMTAQAERLGPGTLSRYAEIVHTGLIDMRGATSPRLVLELLCARMLLPAAVATDAVADSAVLQRLERLERRVTVAPAAVEAAPAAKPAPQAAPVRTPTPTPVPEAAPEPVAVEETPPEPEPVREPVRPGVMDAATVRRVWPELLTEVRRQPSGRSTEAMLTNATVQEIDGDTVIIAHAAAPLARRLAEARNVDLVAQALNNVIGGQWKVRCVHAGQALTQPTQAPPPPRPQPTRPSRAATVEPPRREAPRPAADQDVPPPPEPSEPDDPLPPPPPQSEEDAEAEMLAEASQEQGDGERVTPRDPEETAIELLAQELGARKI
jgi:DNA polymerase-3 subunit gamma/tau